MGSRRAVDRLIVAFDSKSVALWMIPTSQTYFPTVETTSNKKIQEEGIRTADLWSQNRPLDQGATISAELLFSFLFSYFELISIERFFTFSEAVACFADITTKMALFNQKSRE